MIRRNLFYCALAKENDLVGCGAADGWKGAGGGQGLQLPSRHGGLRRENREERAAGHVSGPASRTQAWQ
jgi:hypothetical protein